jgi:hypothetical protein
VNPVGHQKAQKAQRKEHFALADTFSEWVTMVSTSSLQFVPFSGH